ncbi:hypothetical protein CXB51_008706 [Gossypium anomalum]|uniref:Reverse transcriptase zinc-binding domain-containing protein n=1 Tax=Gossypium anomalum TaxID=47600 RepID=A0A8J5ZFL2_9ROSI|nr:hypothetical protein CXB51_008706 [Gossypium anomalum]
MFDSMRHFSVKSAYAFFTRTIDATINKTWELIWYFLGSQRIQIFLWLVVSNKLLTNEHRVQWHIVVYERCDFCGDSIESISHVLRHCTPAKAI